MYGHVYYTCTCVCICGLYICIIYLAIMCTKYSYFVLIIVSHVHTKATKSAEKIWKVKTQSVKRKKTGRIMLSSDCPVFNHKKSKFIKELETSGLLSKLGIKA